MNILQPTIAGIIGLGAPELVLILIILTGFFAAAVAVVMAIVFRRTKKDDSAAASHAAHKKCPDCAELVLIEARVCRHCGYRFDREDAKRA